MMYSSCLWQLLVYWGLPAKQIFLCLVNQMAIQVMEFLNCYRESPAAQASGIAEL